MLWKQASPHHHHHHHGCLLAFGYYHKPISLFLPFADTAAVSEPLAAGLSRAGNAISQVWQACTGAVGGRARKGEGGTQCDTPVPLL